jgi:hypothetical protein
MSSDTFYVTVRAISGASVELVCKTSTAGGLNDFATTRSFALIAIADGMPYGGEKPLQQDMIAAAGGQTPAPTWEEAYHRDNVHRFIASTALLERSNIIDDERAWWAAYEQDAAPRHEFVLRVTMTDPGYLEGLDVGDGWGTTAFDAWYPDPAGPTRDEVAAVTAKASHWPR